MIRILHWITHLFKKCSWRLLFEARNIHPGGRKYLICEVCNDIIWEENFRGYVNPVFYRHGIRLKKEKCKNLEFLRPKLIWMLPPWIDQRQIPQCKEVLK